MIEVWKDVPGYEGHYEISNLSNVRSVDRLLVNCNGKLVRRKGVPIVGRKISNKGYLSVPLSLNGKVRNVILHRVVARLFCDNLTLAPQVNHIDGNKRNNSAANLEWVTAVQNIHHSVDTGLKNKGIKPLVEGTRMEKFSVL